MPGLLVRAARQRLTARLSLSLGGSVRFLLGYQDGALVLAGSTSPSEWLGTRMRENGKITFDQEAQADTLMRANQSLFGEALVSLGVLTADDLERTLLWHHSWLLRRVLGSAEVACKQDVVGRHPQVVPRVPVMRCIEEAVAQYGDTELEELKALFGEYRFQVAAGELELALHLGCSEQQAGLLEAARGSSKTFSQLIGAAFSDKPVAQAAALVLSGMVNALPRIREVAGSGSGQSAMPIPLPGSPMPVPMPMAATPPSSAFTLPNPPIVIPTTPEPARLPQRPAELEEYDAEPALEAMGSSPGLVGLSDTVLDTGQGDSQFAGRLVARSVLYAAVAVAFVVGIGAGTVLGIVLHSASGPQPASTGSIPVADAPVPPASPSPVPVKPAAAPMDALHEQVNKHLEAGHLLLKKDQVRKAITEYRKVLALDANEGRAYRALGIAYTKLGDADGAVRAYKTYLTLMPTAEDGPAIRDMINQYEGSR